MKRLFAVAVAMFALVAFADETTTKTAKKTTTTTADGKKKTVTGEQKTTNDPAGMNNSVTDTNTQKTEMKANDTGGHETDVEKTDQHDAPGMKNDKKTTTKSHVVRDANGKVIEENTTTK
ncbi:MAG: hypothetical protein IPJ65_30960 [Archangiaceae bacterium]|nr:hypothetical protein [Archangiaceae bacterium]